MPLVYKIPRCFPEGADIRGPADSGRGLSGSPGSRGPCFPFRVFAIIFMVFGLITFLLPGTVPAARLAGEEQPVTTAPAGSTAVSPAAGAPSRVQTNLPANAGTPAVSVPAGSTSAASPVAVTPAGIQANPPANAGASAASIRPSAPVPPRPVSPAAFGQRVAGMPPSPAPPAVQKPAETPPPPASQPAASQPAAPSQAGRYVTIDFDNVDISVFIKFVSELTGRNFVVDDKVKG